MLDTKQLTHLKQLEAESIHIIREVVAEFDNPVMMYSVGKDSAVMLHLALKAFAPAKLPFPLLHVDTLWKFKEMIAFRDKRAKEEGFELLVHTNPDGIAQGIGPFPVTIEGFKNMLNIQQFDAVFGGARRDEEKSRAKERIYSFRDKNHRWDPKNQRPELWNIYNARVHKDESIRVFPLSNWTELDIWQYIYLEQIPIVPLYFAAKRPVVEIFNDWMPNDNCFVSVDEKYKDKYGIPVANVRIGAHPEDVRVGEFLATKAVQLLKRMGAKNITYAISPLPSQNLQAGGCRFGDNPKKHVLNRYCQSHDIPNLFVTDGSFMPTGGSVPYTWTIYANAFRVAEYIKTKFDTLVTL